MGGKGKGENEISTLVFFMAKSVPESIKGQNCQLEKIVDFYKNINRSLIHVDIDKTPYVFETDIRLNYLVPHSHFFLFTFLSLSFSSSSYVLLERKS